MDLAAGAKEVWVMMTLFTKKGEPKLVPSCTYPLTGKACVTRVYTDLATFRITDGSVRVTATDGITFDELAARLEIPLTH